MSWFKSKSNVYGRTCVSVQGRTCVSAQGPTHRSAPTEDVLRRIPVTLANGRRAMPDPNITRQQLIDRLNEDLSREYQAIIAYVVYSQVLKGAEYMAIAVVTWRRVRRTIAAVRIAPRGFAFPVPAMSGADPCTGS